MESFILCARYDGGRVAISSALMDTGSNGGNLGGVDFSAAWF